MAATDLSFSKNEENKYVASFVSEGPVTIQVKRQEAGSLNIYANIDGMDAIYVGGYGPYNGSANLIFNVDVPAGVNVSVESFTEVLEAKKNRAMNNIELNKVAIQSIGIDTIRLPGVGSASARGSGSLFHKSLVDAWFMSGYSNDNPPASISGYKGHELVLKNFAFAGSSGFGKYAQSFLLWLFGNRVNNDSTKHYNKFHIVKNAGNVNNYFGLSVGIPKANYNNSIPYKLKITTDSQNPVNFKISSSDSNLNTTDAFSYVVNNGDIIDVPVIPEDIFNNSIETRVYYAVNTNANIYFDIELLPDNAGSLVFDSVDDYAVCDNMPIQTDYTVICRRQIWDKQNDNEAVIASKSLSYDTGAFIFELLKNSTNDQCRSFGTLSSILVEKSDSISYQTSTSYNGTNITKGTGTDTDILYLGNIRKNDNRYLYGAIYYFALYDKSLTPDEIEQEKIKLNEIWTKRLNG